MALDIAFLIGFREIVFIGVDLGSKTKERLHAQGYKTPNLSREKEKLILVRSYTMKGNFEGEVFVPKDFYSSKKVLEEQIRYYKKSYPYSVFVNSSDGVEIEGAVPMPASNLFKITFGKKDFFKDIHFPVVEIHKLNYRRNFIINLLKTFKIIFKLLKESKKTLKEKEYDKLCSNVKKYSQLLGKEYPFSYIFLSIESLRIIQRIAFLRLFLDPQKENDFLKEINRCCLKEIFEKFSLYEKSLKKLEKFYKRIV